MTALDKTVPTIPAAKDRLREHAKRIETDPRTNSVFAYAQELFQQLEAGTIGLSDLRETALNVYGDRVMARADRFRRQHSEAPQVETRIKALAEKGWDRFKTTVETPLGGVVFTAHPTFAMSRTARAKFAAHVTENSEASAAALKASIQEDGRAWSASISLLGEHDEVQETITHAQTALSRYAVQILDAAQEHFPDQWRALKISVPTLASWVGYDLDGRTDIHWSQSFALRLQEKAVQLARYAEALSSLAGAASSNASDRLHAMKDAFARAAELTAEEATIFNADLTDADNLVAAANTLTAEHEDRIVSVAPFVADLQRLAQDEGDDD